MDPAKDADGLHPVNLGRLVLDVPGAAAVHAASASSSCCAATTCRSPAPRSWSIGRGITVGRPLGLLLTRRTENATVTLCHTGTRDLAAHVRTRRHRRRRGRRPGADHRGHGQAGRRRPRRRRQPGRRARSPATSPWTSPRWPGYVAPEPGRGRADDPGDAAAERRPGRRAGRRARGAVGLTSGDAAAALRPPARPGRADPAAAAARGAGRRSASGCSLVVVDHWRRGLVIIGLALVGGGRAAAAAAGAAGRLPRRPEPAGGRRPARRRPGWR